MKKTIIPFPGWAVFSGFALFIMLVLFAYELYGLYLELFVYSKFHSAISTIIITIETLVFLGLFALIILCVSSVVYIKWHGICASTSYGVNSSVLKL